MTVVRQFGFADSGLQMTEAFWQQIFGGLDEGVFVNVDNECEVVQSGTPAMSVEVKTGQMVVGGVFGAVTVQDILTISDGDGSNPRIDRIIAKRDNAADTFTVYVLEGTPAASPSPPALTRAGDDYEISLAQVLVATGETTSIVTADITDERYNYDVCGWVTGRGRRGIEVLDVEQSQVDAEDISTEVILYSFTIPAGAMGIDGGFELSLGGNMLVNTAGSLKFRIRLGGTTVFLTAAVAPTVNANRYRWHWTIQCMNSSVTTQKWTTLFNGRASTNPFALGTGDSTLGFEGRGHTPSGVEDTADPLLFEVTVDWNIANAGLSFRKESAVLKLIPPTP